MTEGKHKQTVCEDRAHWLKARANSIGASEVAAILGFDEWQTPLEVYANLVERLEGRAVGNGDQRMEIGLLLEPVVDTLYQRATTRRTEQYVPFSIETNSEFPWLHATPDRMIFPVPGYEGHGRLELKTTGARMAERWANGPPLAVEAQLQTQLLVSGRKWGSVAVLIGGQEFKYWDFLASESVCDYIIRKTSAFWQRVEERNPPPPMIRDTDVIRRLFPRHVPAKTIQLDESWLKVSRRIVELKAEIKERKGEQEGLENQLRLVLGDAEAGQLPEGLGTWSYKASDIAEHIVKAHTRRTLRFTGSQLKG